MLTPRGVGRSPCRSGHDRVPGRSARGRRAERPGGAGFSTALKLRAAATEGASLVVNACDGEYGAVKDGYVVAYHLSELVRGAESLDRNGFRYAAARGSASEAGCSAGLDVVSVPHRYVSSEESALVSLAGGGLARPMSRRVPVVFGSVSPEGR